MTDNRPPWELSYGKELPSELTKPRDLLAYASNLRSREVSQIVRAYKAGDLEIAAEFVWARSMVLLKRELSALGSEFIGEMLQRPEIGASSDLVIAVSDIEAIQLAEDLGVVPALEAIRLRHIHEVLRHIGSPDSQEGDTEEEKKLAPEEALMCLRTCVRNVLGRPRTETARDFAHFRHKLEEENLDSESAEVTSLLNSPYFFQKTTLLILLALLRTAEGAQLEHVVENTKTIIPKIWPSLRKPEKWQTGRGYAELYSEGRTDAVAGLQRALVRVSGFDYVPEGTRSTTFIRAASDVLAAHEGFDNFANEKSPMSKLASLGSAIPTPALFKCMTAALSVSLGNIWGYSWAAEPYAEKFLAKLTRENWKYYLNECLPGDRQILFKLQEDRPSKRWTELAKAHDLSPDLVTSVGVKSLLRASNEGNRQQINRIANALYKS